MRGPVDIGRALGAARSLELSTVASEEPNSANATNAFMWHFILRTYPQLVAEGLFTPLNYQEFYDSCSNVELLEAVAYVAFLRSQVFETAGKVGHPDDEPYTDFMYHANFVFWLKLIDKVNSINHGTPLQHRWRH